jgi:hypothetical protein
VRLTLVQITAACAGAGVMVTALLLPPGKAGINACSRGDITSRV